MNITFDTSDFEKKLKKFEKLLEAGSDTVNQTLLSVAYWLLALSQRHAPNLDGRLASSANAVIENDGVTFGFNTIYATVQDQGYKGEILKPKNKKLLYVPMNKRGRDYHTLGANPADEGLVFNVDYTLKASVVIPTKAYGSKKGPNKYFSQTLDANKKKVFSVFAKKLKEEMDNKQ